MDPLSAAVPLARSFMSLSAGRASGLVRVSSGNRRARLQLLDGQLGMLDGVDAEALGDTLLRHGALDAAAHAHALRHSPARSPVGRWLVEVGAASASSVALALQLQARARIAAMLRWPKPQYVFQPGVVAGGDTDFPGVPLALAVWEGMLVLARECGAPSRPPREAPWELTGSGRMLLDALAREGSSSVSLAAAALEGAAASEEAACLLRALVALGAVRAASPRADAYGLLLRKQRQLRKRASPRALLDLDANADRGQARRALRRLAGRLHPDRFTAEPGIKRVSGEVLAALARAESTYRR